MTGERGPFEPPEPPMHEEWEGVETWTEGPLRYPVPGGWDLDGHGKFHTIWLHDDGTKLKRLSKRTAGTKDTFVFKIDGAEIHRVDTGPERVELREDTVWLLQFIDERLQPEYTAEQIKVELQKARNQSLDAFGGGSE